MNSQQLQRPTLTTRQANARRWQWLGLGLIGIVAALAIYFYAASVGAPQAQLAQPIVAQSAALDPAAQGVNGYLRAHASVGQAVAIDPAVQGVMNYIQVHASILAHAAVAPLDLDDRYPLPNLGTPHAVLVLPINRQRSK